MSDQVIHRCATKAIRGGGEHVLMSPRWITAKRGTLEVSSGGLRCGKWHIAYDDMDKAILHSVPWLWLLGFVRVVHAHGTVYQFGLNPSSFWKGDFPFQARRAADRSNYWFVVNIVRVLAIITLVGILVRGCS